MQKEDGPAISADVPDWSREASQRGWDPGRRLLRAIAKGEEITQDVSTLENPAILQQLKEPAA